LRRWAWGRRVIWIMLRSVSTASLMGFVELVVHLAAAGLYVLLRLRLADEAWMDEF